MRALPGVAPSSVSKASFGSTAADEIPQNVLASPIIGEARRFDGAAAPPGWFLMRGETLKVAEYGALFRVLGTIGGGDGKMNFKLPAPKQGWIVAVAGMFPTSPQIFSQLGRHVSRTDSLGPGAQLAPPVPSLKQEQIAARRSAALREQQQLVQSAVRYRSGRATPLSPEAVARMSRAREDARTAVLAALSATNREQALALVDAILAGASISDATRRSAATLSTGESIAVLGVFDATERALGGSLAPHGDVTGDAGRFVIQVAFTAAQLRRLRAMQRDD